MSSPGRRGSPVPLVLLAAAALLAFSPTLLNGFLPGLDDGDYLLENPRVRPGLTAAGARWALTATYAANWHPLTWWSHMLDVTLFGLAPAGHHLTSLLLHAASALLLLAFLRRATGAPGPSFLAAALFAVHPLRVESVAWASERKDVLSAFLGLLALHLYLGHVRRPSSGRLAGVAAALALGLMAKPMLVTLPLLLLVLDFWPLGRLAAGGRRAGEGRLRVIGEKLPLAALSAGAAAIAWRAQAAGEMLRTAADYPLAVRLAQASLAGAHYVVRTAWPLGLSTPVAHPGVGISFPGAAAALAALLGASLAALALRRRAPAVTAGWLWYLVVLAPVSGIVQLADQGTADRYSYLPSVGIAVALAWSAAPWCAGRAARSRLVAALCAFALAALASLTWRQARFWRDEVTLFSRALAVDSRNALAWNGLGAALARQGRAAEAEVRFREAVRLREGYPDARYNLALTLAAQDRHAEAAEQLSRLVETAPRDADARLALGVASARLGRQAEAAAHFAEAVRLRPEDPVALNNLGAALADLGRDAEAIPRYRAALALRPGYPEARANLARALERTHAAADPGGGGEAAPEGGEPPFRKRPPRD